MHALYHFPSIAFKDKREHLHRGLPRYEMCDSVCADSVLNFDSTALGAYLFNNLF